MHIVESGKRYRIFNNAITTYDQLPPKTYRVDYDPDTRTFSLLEAHDFEIPETKIYGQHLDKVKKVLNAMDKMNRNLGVILSGDKGIGKSLFSKCLGLKARKKGIPVILVNEYNEGIANFLEEIEQTVCTDFSIKNNETNTYGNVKGESLITPGKYDRLYPDANMYPVNKTEKYDWKDKMMNKAADLYYDSDKKDTYFVIYIMSFILFLVFLDLIYTLFIGIPIGIISFLFIA